jgi:nucleotide-binding universal stress UspA family protein
MTMRILIAHDLSGESERAAALIARTAWWSGTVIRVVTSPAGMGPVMSSFAGLHEARAHAREIRNIISVEHERIAGEVRRSGAAVETATVAGRPTQAVLKEAERFGADLIVVGARSQGSLAATLLGSVSRGIVEESRCSVLVARHAAISRVVLAADGSSAANAGAGMVATWPLFEGVRVRVVGVSEAPPRYPSAVLRDAEHAAAFSSSLDAGIRGAEDAVTATVATLSSAGREVEGEIRLGDAAPEITAVAREWAADLVVVGARTEPLLRRVLLGSVARRVIDSPFSSVLVVRPKEEFGPHGS